MAGLLLRRPQSFEETFLLLCCSEAPVDGIGAELDALSRAKWFWPRVLTRLEDYPFNDGAAPLWNAFDLLPSLAARSSSAVVQAVEKIRSFIRCESSPRLDALSEVLRQLEQRGLRPILLKGPALVAAAYYPRGARMFNDVDLLVEWEAVDKVELALRSIGFYGLERYERYRSRYLTEHHHLPPLFQDLSSSRRLCVEIHWQASGYLSSPAFTRGLRDRARSTPWNEGVALLPSAIDLFLHGILDLASHHLQKGIKVFCDLQRIAAHEGDCLDWDQIRFAIGALGLTAEANLVRELLRRLLHWQVPPLTDPHSHGMVSPEVFDAAEELVLRRPSRKSRLLRQVARWLTRCPRSAHVHWTHRIGQPRRRHSISGWLATASRVATTLPRGLDLIRNDIADLVVNRWIQEQDAARAVGGVSGQP